MRNEIFRESNWKTMLFLSAVLVLLALNGVFGLYSLYRSHRLTSYYDNAADRVTDMRVVFLKQSRMWKNMLLARNHARDYKEFYYRFSQYAAQVQDALFNLKTDLEGNRTFTGKLQALREVHAEFSRNYASLMFKMEREHAGEKDDPAMMMHDDEEMALSRMDAIIEEIRFISDEEIERGFRNYFILVSFSLALLMAGSLFIVVRTIVMNRRTQKRMIEIGNMLDSYLPPQLVRNVLAGKTTPAVITGRKTITVCFSDLQGFTTLTERLPPDTTARILNEYLSDMASIAHAWGGTVDKFIGDGIMILFGALEDIGEREQAECCVGMARAMQEHMADLRRKWRDEGIESSLHLRIGINSGAATVGTFGPEDRRTYTAIGSMVNIAARMEKLCAVGGVLIGESTRGLLGEDIECASLEPQKIRGISDSVRLYQIIPVA